VCSNVLMTIPLVNAMRDEWSLEEFFQLVNQSSKPAGELSLAILWDQRAIGVKRVLVILEE